jgi:hypothetical protein
MPRAQLLLQLQMLGREISAAVAAAASEGAAGAAGVSSAGGDVASEELRLQVTSLRERLASQV